MACAICQTRREKRYCPGIQANICAICCGEQREETITCPFECEYLQQAHALERPEVDPATVPNRDFSIPRDFLQKNVELIVAFQNAVLKAALDRNAVDYDVREALDGLVRTYQTLGSGLYYESRPTNPLAAAVFESVQNLVEEIRRSENESGTHKLTDHQILTVLIFLQHLEYAFNNGRKRGRLFLHNTLGTLQDLAGRMAAKSPSLIVT